MKIIKTEIINLIVIEPKKHGDHRGWFSESYNKELFNENGITIDFVQDNHSFTKEKGTLRGLHFQLNPKAQSKLVRCTKGKILDVAVDLRKGSPTYLKSFAIELSDENNLQLLVPQGFAHGFLTLTDDVEVQYKVDEFYSFDHDRSIKFNDPKFNINWGLDNPILSKKDEDAPLLENSDVDFNFMEEK